MQFEFVPKNQPTMFFYVTCKEINIWVLSLDFISIKVINVFNVKTNIYVNANEY